MGQGDESIASMLCFFVAVLLSSCQFNATTHKLKITSRNTSICDIVRHKKNYIGRTVELRAIYKSDKSSYSFFEDPSSYSDGCLNKAIIQTGYVSAMHDKSVVKFFHAGDALCEKKRSAICSLTADVDFSAKIFEDEDGLYIQLEKVNHFSFY